MIKLSEIPLVKEGLIINRLGEELLVYDPQTHQAHRLEPAARRVFEACQRQLNLAEMVAELKLEREVLEFILSQLLQKGLLVRNGIERREFMKLGSGLALSTLISSILVPSPAEAVSLETSPPGQVVELSPLEDYEHLPENGFLAVQQHPLSTFAADVDTASYANVRRFLNEGQLPPPDSVRIEEMINYFDYQYQEPAGEPFSVDCEVQVCPWNSKHQLLRIGLQGQPMDKDLPPRNLVFLLDVSGSMSSPKKLPLLKKGLKTLVNTLVTQDRVSIVVYAGSSGLVLDSAKGNQKESILEALERLEAGGSTNGGEGIELAYRVAEKNFIKGGVNRVILATDGDFNVGTQGRGSLERLIEKKRETGVYLTVLGLGTGNLKDSTLELLADKGNGNYAYLDSHREARKVLVEEAGGTLVTIAKDVKIQVEFNPINVVAYRLIGYENRKLEDHDFADDSKDGGEVGAGHQVTALYELIRPDDYQAADTLRFQSPRQPKAGKEGELALVKLRFKPPEGDTSRELQSIVKRDLSKEASTDFRFVSAVAAFGMILRQSQYRGTADLAWVEKVGLGALGTDEGGYRAEFLKLVKKARALA